jgi:hypothetical protein
VVRSDHSSCVETKVVIILVIKGIAEEDAGLQLWCQFVLKHSKLIRKIEAVEDTHVLVFGRIGKQLVRSLWRSGEAQLTD